MRRALILLGIFLCLGTQTRAGELTVYTEISGKSSYYDGNELTGAAVELVREIMRRTGRAHPIRVVPWMRGYDALLNDPDVALFSTTRTRERDPLFHWVGPISRIQWLFLKRKGSGITIRDVNDARKVRAIGTYLGDARERYLQRLQFTNIESAQSNEMNFRKLQRGRLDLVFSSTGGMREAMERAGVSPASFEIAHVVREVDLYVAMSRDTAPATVRAWKDALQAMRDDGTFREIYTRWNPGQKPPLTGRPPQ